MKSVNSLVKEGNLSLSTINLYSYLVGHPETTTLHMMQHMDVGKARVSQHLRLLREANLIKTKRKGYVISVTFI